MLTHPFPPLFDKNSKILILGSFPSVKSREQMFFYGHPQNRFWKVIAAVFQEETPMTIAEKKEFLLSHKIALWDVLSACEIKGSSDSSITKAIPNDLTEIFEVADIKRIYVNGKTAEKYYKLFQQQKINMKAVCLPSTSPANAAWSFEKLCNAWCVIKIQD